MEFELAPFDLAADYADGIVSLAAVKEHLRVEHDAEDDLIGFFRDAAVDMVERYCGVRLGACAGLTWQAESLTSPLCLGVWPVTAINSITWLDSTGTEITGDVAAWRVASRDKLLLKPGQSMPSGVAAGVTINFDAGFTDANRPAALVQAVKLFTAHLYLNREAVEAGSVAGETPLGFRQLCRAYRMPTI